MLYEHSPGNPAGSTKSLIARGTEEFSFSSSAAFAKDSRFSHWTCSFESPSNRYLLVTSNRRDDEKLSAYCIRRKMDLRSEGTSWRSRHGTSPRAQESPSCESQTSSVQRKKGNVGRNSRKGGTNSESPGPPPPPLEAGGKDRQEYSRGRSHGGAPPWRRPPTAAAGSMLRRYGVSWPVRGRIGSTACSPLVYIAA
jgi:hypothetical protein